MNPKGKSWIPKTRGAQPLHTQDKDGSKPLWGTVTSQILSHLLIPHIQAGAAVLEQQGRDSGAQIQGKAPKPAGAAAGHHLDVPPTAPSPSRGGTAEPSAGICRICAKRGS